MNYYNDNDPYAAQWLRNLVSAGHLPPGDVDNRSILEVSADDLRGYEQCHFFAGIGGWPLALEYAGWRGPVWTGSCPCQPLSSAGKRKGDADERHLWPAFQQLIAECHPGVVFGEQVASKDGREWLSAVRTDLESVGYACGAADLSAAGVGAPHIRQRLYWVANAAHIQQQTDLQRYGQTASANGTRQATELARDCGTDWPIGSIGHECKHRMRCDHQCGLAPGCCGGMCCEFPNECTGHPGECVAGGLGNANIARPQGRRGGLEQESSERAIESGSAVDGMVYSNGGQPQSGNGRKESGQEYDGPSSYPNWRDVEWLACADGKARPTQPGIHPLADGLPGRVGRLRSYGNAIVPQVAATFVRSFMEIALPTA